MRGFFFASIEKNAAVLPAGQRRSQYSGIFSSTNDENNKNNANELKEECPNVEENSTHRDRFRRLDFDQLDCKRTARPNHPPLAAPRLTSSGRRRVVTTAAIRIPAMITIICWRWVWLTALLPPLTV